MTATLTPQDLGLITTYGRYVGRDGDTLALRNAAEMVVTAKPEEVNTLMFYFEEGLRNYVSGMHWYNLWYDRLKEEILSLRNSLGE